MQPGQPFSPYRAFTGIFIPDVLIPYRGINAAEKICLARLYRYCGKKDHCWPSQEELAEELGVEVRSVHTYLAHLEEQGFISIQRPGLQKPNVYQMLGHPIFCDENTPSLTGNNFPVQTGSMSSDQDRQGSSGPTYRTEESQKARESKPVLDSPSSAETTPSDQEIINALRGLTSAQKKIVHATDHSGMTLAEAVAHHRAAFGNAPRRQVPRSDNRGIVGFSRGDAQPRRVAIKPTFALNASPFLREFRVRYTAVNPSTVEPDWDKCVEPSENLTEAEQAKALERIQKEDGAWVQDPANYLRDKRFMRPPRPEPKSNAQKLLEMA